MAGVVAAGRRGFIADAIDGTRTPASHSLEINLRYNQLLHPLARAFGMVMTALPTLGAYAWLMRHARHVRGS